MQSRAPTTVQKDRAQLYSCTAVQTLRRRLCCCNHLVVDDGEGVVRVDPRQHIRRTHNIIRAPDAVVVVVDGILRRNQRRRRRTGKGFSSPELSSCCTTTTTARQSPTATTLPELALLATTTTSSEALSFGLFATTLRRCRFIFAIIISCRRARLGLASANLDGKQQQH